MAHTTPDLSAEKTPPPTAVWQSLPTPSMHQASEMLERVLRSRNVIGVLTGTRGAGREATLRRFAANVRTQGIPATIVDGRGLDRAGLLSEVLRGFGYQPEGLAADDLFGILRVFLIHKGLAEEPPFLGVLHVAEMQPSALCELCRLAAIETTGEKPLRLALSGDKRVDYLLSAPSTDALRDRHVERFELQPMDLIDAGRYIASRLETAGAGSQQGLFTDNDTVALLWRASGGLADKMDALIRKVLEVGASNALVVEEIAGPELASAEEAAQARPRSSSRPESVDARPRVLVTLDDNTVIDRCLDVGLALIGRERDSDICLPGRYVSRRHAMLVVGDHEAKVVDLKSTNGILVGGKRTTVAILRDGQTVQLGGYRLTYRSRRHSSVSVDADRRDDRHSLHRRRFLGRLGNLSASSLPMTPRATPPSLSRQVPVNDAGGPGEEGPRTL